MQMNDYTSLHPSYVGQGGMTPCFSGGECFSMDVRANNYSPLPAIAGCAARHCEHIEAHPALLAYDNCLPSMRSRKKKGGEPCGLASSSSLLRQGGMPPCFSSGRSVHSAVNADVPEAHTLNNPTQAQRSVGLYVFS